MASSAGASFFPKIYFMKIAFSKVSCNGNELKYIKEVLASGWLTTAGKTIEFERRFAAAVGVSHACAVYSCTAALHLALEAIGIGPGDEVIVPTLTFTATAEVVRYLGADPVFVDVEYGSGLVTPAIIEEALARHPKVKAVIIVHFAGQVGNMTSRVVSREDCSQRDLKSEGMVSPIGDRRENGSISIGKPPVEPPQLGIVDICRRRGVRLIEDAALAFPARQNGRQVGTFGDITCFSFYANKTITTGEGGMLVTNDDAIYRRVKIMRLHGINRDVWDRFTAAKPSWEYDVVAPGFKYNLPDLAAAVGLAQLERAEELRERRQAVAVRYMSVFSSMPGIDLPLVHGALEDHAWHIFWLVLRQDADLDRAAFIDKLIAREIGFSVHYKPLHRMTYYRERYQLCAENFPNAERHWKGCVSLPLYASMTDEELEYVCDQISDILKKK